MRHWPLGLVLMLSIGCSADASAPKADSPATISITGVQSAYTAGEKATISVKAVGTDLGPIANVPIAFVPSRGGMADPATAVTDANGVATTTWTMPVTIGIAELRANSGASSFQVATEVRAAAAARINKLAGDAQQGDEGALLPIAVRVTVTDAFGNAIVSRAVAFVVTAGGGSVTASSATTAADGSASVEWRVGVGSTVNSVEVRTPDVPPVTFTATARRLDGIFALTGNMSTVRSGHTATLLLDGRVLVVGGESSTSDLATAELYDPASGSFSPTANIMTTARTNHSATLLADGRVLIAGGSERGVWLKGAELFDPATNRFEPTNSLLDPQSLQEGTLLASGEVLLTGGWTGRQARAELYNTATGQFRYTGPYADTLLVYDEFGQFGVPATLLSNGTVLLASSWRVEIFDPALGTFVAGTSTDDHCGGTATLLTNGKVLLAGGGGNNDFGPYAKTERYDPATRMFLIAQYMRYGRIFHTATRLASGKVLVAGGLQGNEVALAAAEVFDVNGTTWTAVGAMQSPRARHRATRLHDGRILITGGSFSSAELFTERP